MGGSLNAHSHRCHAAGHSHPPFHNAHVYINHTERRHHLRWCTFSLLHDGGQCSTCRCSASHGAWAAVSLPVLHGSQHGTATVMGAWWRVHLQPGSQARGWAHTHLVCSVPFLPQYTLTDLPNARTPYTVPPGTPATNQTQYGGIRMLTEVSAPGKQRTARSPDEELRRSFRRRETPKFFRSDRKMTPAQPEAQVLYRTLAWCAVARGASDAERDQSRSAYTPGKREPQTGDDPRDPHRPGT